VLRQVAEGVLIHESEFCQSNGDRAEVRGCAAGAGVSWLQLTMVSQLGAVGEQAARLRARGTNARRYSPSRPSIRSRSRSAWPLCRAYSSTMCTSTQRSDIGPRKGSGIFPATSRSGA
jgi:hypothetical protein